MLFITLLLGFSPLQFEFIKPIRQGLDDFDIYDLAFPSEEAETGTIDTGITILGIGNSRADIIAELMLLERFKPGVVGIDALFEQPGDSATDLVLEYTLKALNPVVASKYESAGDSQWIRHSFFATQLPSLKEGFFNFPEGPEQVKRHFLPFLEVNGKQVPAFTTRLLERYSPEKYQLLLQRKNKSEIIRYYGGRHHFPVVSFDSLQTLDSARAAHFFSGKIVLIGFITDHPPEILEDLHFTPMNHKHSGKSFPDNYGVIIHANILATMEMGEYISQLQGWASYLFSFLVLFPLNVFYIRRLSRRGHHNHLFLFLFQFLFAFLLLYAGLLLFSRFRIRIDLKPLILAVVLSLEMFWIYEWLALRCRKWFHYETFLH